MALDYDKLFNDLIKPGVDIEDIKLRVAKEAAEITPSVPPAMHIPITHAVDPNLDIAKFYFKIPKK